MKQEVLQFVFVESHLELRVAYLVLYTDDLPHDVLKQRRVVDKLAAGSYCGEHLAKPDYSLWGYLNRELEHSEHDDHELLQ